MTIQDGNMPEQPIRYLLTLLHGTYAANAAWTHDGSEFCDRMREGLRVPRDHVKIDTFHWTGHNSVRARTRAATHLRTHLQTVSQAHQGYRHFVIGHSHAGNIILKALSETHLPVAGVVCLSTPFIAAQSFPKPFIN